MHERTAFGAAISAGLGAGIWESVEELDDFQEDKQKTFIPQITSDEATKRYDIWKKAVRLSTGWTDDS